MDQGNVSAAGLKLCVAWLGVCASYVISWQDIAGMLASLYTALLIGEWLWKHGVRYLLERTGWLKPKAPKSP
jgi:hypothetical protein